MLERERNERCTEEDAGRGQVVDSVSQATEEFLIFILTWWKWETKGFDQGTDTNRKIALVIV